MLLIIPENMKREMDKELTHKPSQMKHKGQVKSVSE